LFKYPIIFLLLVAALPGCKKQDFISGPEARLRISADSIRFDTVFTSTGSITQFVRIFNENDEKLLLNNIKLAGGASSPFKINVDGLQGPSVNNIELDANDSTYLFVTVTINPTATKLPFIVRDSISIEYNGNIKWIQLQAWGQNARFLRSKVVQANEVWTDSLPYVIIGDLTIAQNVTLTIQKGTRIFLHADAPILVEGTLLVNGEQYDSTKVIFTGDRLDEPYRDFPASWPGIYFRKTSKDNVMNFASIKNAYQGIVVEDPSNNANPKLVLFSCIVDNCYDAGLLAVKSDIKATNCLFSNSSKNIILIHGGKYDFTHCTDAAYSNEFILHKDPVLFVSDFIKTGNVISTANLQATFTNCIFWGDNGTVETEIVTAKLGTGTFTVSFIHCLWKEKEPVANITKVNPVINEDPRFDSINIQKRFFSFRLQPVSPAINKGVNTGVMTDLDGKLRPIGLPDLGSYEKNP